MNRTTLAQTGLQLLMLALVILAFTVGSSVHGLALGGLVALSWWALPPMYAFVLGHFALVLVVPDGGGLDVLAATEVGLVGLLCTTTIGPPRPGRVLALACGAVGGATGLIWLGLDRLATVWGMGGVVIGAGAILAYWIHRYERVALELPMETSNDE